jgi:hypothetical protein
MALLPPKLPKDVVLQIFIGLKKYISSAGFELGNLGLNVEHDNHYATEAD